jgi:hypothetical protein
MVAATLEKVITYVLPKVCVISGERELFEEDALG